MPPGILLADGQTLVRESLRAILEAQGFTVVAETANPAEAPRLARDLQPDVTILSLSVSPTSLDAVREMARACPRTRTILLAEHTQERDILEGLKAGVRGCVLKTQALADLVQAIRDVVRGMTYLGPRLSRLVAEAYLRDTRPAADSRLTTREREVVQLVAEGKTTKEVARCLGVSVKTAETHRTRLMKKLEIHETAGMVRYAIRLGLVKP